MKKTALLALGFALAFCLGFFFKTFITKQTTNTVVSKQTDTTINSNIKKGKSMKLGAFSVSLNVKDLKISKEFYETLGFTAFGGGMDKNYLIMKNENALVGLFQGMFQGNILTFNPGWDENAKNIEQFDDVREIQRQLKEKSVKLSLESDDKTTGPGSVMLTDPDGNVILIDQHR